VTEQQPTLAELISARKDGNKSLRGMARRAAAMGTPISASALSAYATGKRSSCPSAGTREALANALDVPIEQIGLAATATCLIQLQAPDLPVLPSTQDWLALIEGRSDAEISGVRDVVRVTLRLWDAAKDEPPS
jgi:transcriptional regulator with XRE-family HTH domain